METLGRLIIGTVIFIINLLMRGFVIMVLWNWFAVSIFKFNPLMMVEAMSIALFIGYLSAKPTKIEEGKEFEMLLDALLFTFVASIMALLGGWALTAFI